MSVREHLLYRRLRCVLYTSQLTPCFLLHLFLVVSRSSSEGRRVGGASKTAVATHGNHAHHGRQFL